MRLLSGAAVLALAASAAVADPGGGHGGGHGGGNGGGGGFEARGGGGDHERGHGGGGFEARGGGGEHGREARAERLRGDDAHGHRQSALVRADHPRAARADERGDGEREASHGNRRQDEAGDDHRGRDAMREDWREADREFARGRDDRDEDGDDVRIVRDEDARGGIDFARLDRRGLVDGCPPGLAKKDNGCMPPGQLKAQRGLSFADRPDWWGFDDARDGRYTFWNGNLVRLGDNGGIAGYLPLLGGALAPGNLWPSFYQPVTLPSYYQDYYGLGAPDNYRYYDDTLYRIDPQSNAITSIAALLTGDTFTIGQALPSGYDLYNVPYPYRDRYADGPDAMYRYSDGYVYQVDPTSQLITAAIELLT